MEAAQGAAVQPRGQGALFGPPVGSEDWARAMARAFDMLRLTECAEVAKPGWWNDEGLKALSARGVR